ncbi:MAG: HAMP domain-containing protein [Deltaproteobacteria bacterium]|nr:HAMP domain-containing protein [Deltaproteobacteria bacterium]
MRRLPPWMTSLSTKLTVGLSLVVVAVFVLFAWLFVRYHDETSLDEAQVVARTQVDLIGMAIEHEMAANDRERLRAVFQDFARERTITRVSLLDADGVVRYSSVPSDIGRRFAPSSPGCAECHDLPTARRTRSTLWSAEGRQLLRTVQPIANGAGCDACHSPTQRTLGLLLLDQPVVDLWERSGAEVRWFAVVAGILALVVLGGTLFIMRAVVLRRVAVLAQAAKALGSGDLDRRVAIGGSDMIADLARHFNEMADGIREQLTEMRRLRAFFETVLDRLAIGVTVFDADGRIEYANRTIRDRFGDVTGRTCREAFGAARPCASCPPAATAADSPVVERRHATPDDRVVDRACVRIEGADGKIRTVETAADVTKGELLGRRLARAERLAVAGEIAAGVVHAINNPLDGMRRALDLAAARPGDARRLEEMHALLREGIDRLVHVTGTLLAFARVDLDGQRTRVDLDELAAAAARLVRFRAEDRGVALELRPATGLPAVNADARGLQEAVVNLLFNALDAVKEGAGRIVVRTGAAADGFVELAVEDDGAGIPPEDLPRVFEPFFTTKPVGKGTGLGLSVARRIVEAHGGEITARSAPGHGSTFTVRLPAAAAGDGAPASPEAAATRRTKPEGRG